MYFFYLKKEIENINSMKSNRNRIEIHFMEVEYWIICWMNGKKKKHVNIRINRYEDENLCRSQMVMMKVIEKYSFQK